MAIDYPLIEKIILDNLIEINQVAKVSELLSDDKKWKQHMLKDDFPKDILNEINNLLIILKIGFAENSLLQVSSLLNRLSRQITLILKKLSSLTVYEP